MQHAAYHQVNLVAQQIKEDINHRLEARDSQVFSVLQSIPDLTSSSSGSSTEEDTSPSHQVNALIDAT